MIEVGAVDPADNELEFWLVRAEAREDVDEVAELVVEEDLAMMSCAYDRF